MQLHRVLINFCFYPVHLQLIVAVNHPMQLQGCAGLFRNKQNNLTAADSKENSLLRKNTLQHAARENLYYYACYF